METDMTVSQTIALSDVFLFRGLPAARQRELTEALPAAESFAKGTVIYNGKTFRRALGILTSGKLCVSRKTGSAAPVVLNRLTAGQVFGAAALFGDSSVFVTEVTAATDCTVVFISQEQMRTLFVQYPPLAEAYIAFLSDRVRFLNRKIAVMAGSSAEERLLCYVQANTDPDGKVLLPKSMTELSRRLGIGRSSLYRAADTLVAEGLLRRDGKDLYTV